MTKIFNKLLLVGVSTCLLSNLAFAQETTCYKNGVERPSLIEDITLDGGICNGKLSLNQMKSNGWDVLDIKINSSQNKFNYTYYFTKNTNANQKANNVLLKTSITEATTPTNKEFSVKPMGLKIGNIENLWRKDKGETTGITQLGIKHNKDCIMELCLEGKCIKYNLIEKKDISIIHKAINDMMEGKPDYLWPINNLVALEIFFSLWE